MKPVSGAFRSVVTGSVVIVRVSWPPAGTREVDACLALGVHWTPVHSKRSVESFFHAVAEIQDRAVLEDADHVTIGTDVPSILPALFETAINYRTGRVVREEVQDMILPEKMPLYFGDMSYGNRVLVTMVLGRLVKEDQTENDFPKMVVVDVRNVFVDSGDTGDEAADE